MAQDHAFWDRANVALFAGVTAVRVADLDSTWRCRARGFNEGILTNGFVDNRPAFTAFSAGMVAGNVLAAYSLHRAGHHKLERILSVVHIGAAGITAARNYRIRYGLF